RLLQLQLEAAKRERHFKRTITPTAKSGECLPLSYAQQRLWVLDREGLVGTAYNIPIVLRLSGTLHDDALQNSLTALISRHSILRTRFSMHDGSPCQIIDPPRPFDLRRSDLSCISDEILQSNTLKSIIEGE